MLSEIFGESFPFGRDVWICLLGTEHYKIDGQLWRESFNEGIAAGKHCQTSNILLRGFQNNILDLEPII